MTTDDQTIAALLAHQRELIAIYGCAITYVLGDDSHPSRFGYTIGLTEHTDPHPEFLIAGLEPAVTAALLNDMAKRVLTYGERFTHGQTVTDLLAGYPAVIVTGPDIDALYPGGLHGHYGTGAFTLQQIVWPDPTGRFPWDHGYRYPASVQPVLGPGVASP